jgi:flavin reductase (DIM6/NTAB) family NADH-FMN oxidoreductase RutF
MTATAFSSVSVDPNLILICVHNQARTCRRVLRSGYFGVNMLASDAVELSAYCARPAANKGLPDHWLVSEARWTAPAVRRSLAFLDCQVYRHFPAGTHRVIIGQVRGIGLAEGRARITGRGDTVAGRGPLVHYQANYHGLLAVEPDAAASAPPAPIVLDRTGIAS